MRGAFLLMTLALLLATACSAPTAPSTMVTGTVHFFPIEGGFWAVNGDDGVTYDPMNTLPAAFQIEGLRVRMLVKVKHDAADTHMVGLIVEILQIDALNGS